MRTISGSLAFLGFFVFFLAGSLPSDEALRFFAAFLISSEVVADIANDLCGFDETFNRLIYTPKVTPKNQRRFKPFNDLLECSDRRSRFRILHLSLPVFTRTMSVIYRCVRDCVCLRFPDFGELFTWLFSRKCAGRLAGLAWIWFFISVGVVFDFWNVMFTTNTASQRAAYSEAGTATITLGNCIITFFLGIQFTIIAVTKMQVRFDDANSNHMQSEQYMPEAGGNDMEFKNKPIQASTTQQQQQHTFVKTGVPPYYDQHHRNPGQEPIVPGSPKGFSTVDV